MYSLLKIAVIIVSRNNPFLLEHAISKYKYHPPGVECDFYIIDASSDDSRQTDLLASQSLARVAIQANDRVEVNFDEAWRSLPGYDYYFFAHDDNVPICDNWLLPFLHRMQSAYVEPECPLQYRNLPIGRVGCLSQYWRSYTDIKGHPIQCLFLKHAIEVVTGQEAPAQFKYADCDRVLVSQECLHGTNGLITINSFHDKREELVAVFDRFLHYYYDEGMYPKSKYPPGKHWNKFTLLSEFLNSVMPLLQGFRTVGVDSDGYLEQIHGEDVPWANRFIAHYGSPNSLAFLAKTFGSTVAALKSRMNDPVLLIRFYQMFRKFYA